MKKELKGKVALVTGSSRGIGKAIALVLAEKGADICVHCQGSLDLANQVSQEIEHIGQRSIVVQSDITSLISIQENIQLIEKTHKLTPTQTFIITKDCSMKLAILKFFLNHIMQKILQRAKLHNRYTYFFYKHSNGEIFKILQPVLNN